MKRRFLGQTLGSGSSRRLCLRVIQVIFVLGRFRTFPILGTIGGAFAQRIFLSAGVMAIVSLGLNLIYGFNGQFSLGQWGFYAIGAYTAADITYRWNGATASACCSCLRPCCVALGYGLISRLIRAQAGLHGRDVTLHALPDRHSRRHRRQPGVLAAAADGSGQRGPGLAARSVSMQIVFVLATLCAGAVAGLISYLFGQPVLKLGGDYFGIATLGLTMVVFVLANNSDKVFPEMKGSRGMVGIPTLTTWFWVFVFLLLALLVMRNLLDSSHGRAIISVREDEIAAKTMGVDTTQYKTLAFVIGSFFAGVAGSLYAHQEGFLHPTTFNFIKSFDPLIIIVFGGLGSMTGTVVASFVWGIVLFYVLPTVLPQGGEGWRFVIYALALLIIMLLRQQGLLGGREWGFLKPTQWPLIRRLARRRKPRLEPLPDAASSALAQAARKRRSR